MRRASCTSFTLFMFRESTVCRLAPSVRSEAISFPANKAQLGLTAETREAASIPAHQGHVYGVCVLMTRTEGLLYIWGGVEKTLAV